MGGLDPWFATHNDIAGVRLQTWGDSTTFGNVTVTNGGWPEQLRLLAAARWGKGGDGLHMVGNGGGNTGRNWATSNGTYAVAGDAWNGGANSGNTYRMTASTHTATWTKPAALSPTAFELVIMDGASSADFSCAHQSGDHVDAHRARRERRWHRGERLPRRRRADHELARPHR
jgi:hypothetical protein